MDIDKSFWKRKFFCRGIHVLSSCEVHWILIIYITYISSQVLCFHEVHWSQWLLGSHRKRRRNPQKVGPSSWNGYSLCVNPDDWGWCSIASIECNIFCKKDSWWAFMIPLAFKSLFLVVYIGWRYGNAVSCMITIFRTCCFQLNTVRMK